MSRPQETAAERARTVLATAVSARLGTSAGQIDLLGGHVALPDGRIVAFVSPRGSVSTALASADAVAARIVLVDLAPVAVPGRERARLEIVGALRAADDRTGAEAWQALRGEPGGPVDAVALELVPDTVVLREGCGQVAVDAADFRAASPDPVAPAEAMLLQHLAHAHRGSVDLLARVAVGAEFDAATDVVPFRITSRALTLRLLRGGCARDVDLVFLERVVDPREADRAVAELVLAGQRG